MRGKRQTSKTQQSINNASLETLFAEEKAFHYSYKSAHVCLRMCVFWPACVCALAVRLLKRRWKLLNIHVVCAWLGPGDKMLMFWQAERDGVCVCECVLDWCCGRWGNGRGKDVSTSVV